MPNEKEPNSNPSSKGSVLTYILLVVIAALYMWRQHLEAENKKIKEGKGSEWYNQIQMPTNSNNRQATNFFNRLSQ